MRGGSDFLRYVCEGIKSRTAKMLATCVTIRRHMIRLVLALSVVTAAFSEAAPNKMAPSVTSRIFRKLSDQADSSFTPVTNDETSAQATPIAMPEVSSLTFSNPPKAKECSDDEDNPGELWFKPDKCIKISPETGSADYGAKFACVCSIALPSFASGFLTLLVLQRIRRMER